MARLVEVLISGILTGSVYSLVAAGLALEFGVLRVINFAHGYSVMVSMYVLAAVSNELSISPYIAVPLSVPLGALLGLGLYYGLIRPFTRRGASPIVVALATVAAALATEQAILWLVGAEPVPVRVSTSLAGFRLAGIHVSVAWLVAAVVAGGVMAALSWALNRTRWGREARAVAMDRDAASALGINPSRISASVFAVGTVLAVTAGGMMITLVPAAPDQGLHFSLIAIVVIVLGGLSSFKGAWVGAILLGVASNLVGFYWDPSMQAVAYLAIFVVVLLARPQGLFGHAGDVGAIHA